MLELLDSGKFAHKYGAKRWMVPAAMAVCWGVVSMLIGNVIDKVGGLAAPTLQNTLWWVEPALLVMAFIPLLQACWWAYIDETRGTYVEEADRYQREGW